MSVQIKDIIAEIEKVAPRSLQESYDNSGVQVGNIHTACTGVLISLDATPEVVQEAIEKGYNLIVTHHPLLFKGLKTIQGNNEIERIVIACIKHDITLYACHTNLDNVNNGVNKKIADKLGLTRLSILQPMRGILYKLITYVPMSSLETVRNAAFQAGAGTIGHYDECSFHTEGVGTFRGDDTSQPSIGIPLQRTTLLEAKVEWLVNNTNKDKVLQAVIKAHPYEEVAYELLPLDNAHQDIGAGMIGYTEAPIEADDFLKMVKSSMSLDVIKYTPTPDKKIHKVAICGGSGAFLITTAMAQGADALITGDIKYHEFFIPEGKMMIADIGHYESEQYTSEIFYDIIKNKFLNFAVQISGITTNPIKYHY